MKVAILAGGFGTRLAEETEVKPKPMVEIGGKPILWHIMKHFARYGLNDFVVALGYRGNVIKKWFADFAALQTDLLVRTGHQHTSHVEPLLPGAGAVDDWEVRLVETGLKTNTGGRVKRLGPWLGGETFLLTWGDGVSDIDIPALLAFHRSHGKLATVSAVRPPARFGHLRFEGQRVAEFSEKPQTAEGWINGAYFVLEPEVLEYIDGDETQFEREPLVDLARDGELMAYRHEGFWQCMDTLRDKVLLERMWESGRPPWRTWEGV